MVVGWVAEWVCCGCNIYWSNLLSPALSYPPRDAPVTKASLSAKPFTYKERNKRIWTFGWDLETNLPIIKLNGILHSQLNKAAVKEIRVSRHTILNTPFGQVMYV